MRVLSGRARQGSISPFIESHVNVENCINGFCLFAAVVRA
jgi:hypothetical protein